MPQAVIGSYSDFLVYDPEGLCGEPRVEPAGAEEVVREALGDLVQKYLETRARAVQQTFGLSPLYLGKPESSIGVG